QGTVARVGHSISYKLMAPIYVLAGMLAAWRLGRRRRFDIVHVHWPVPHALFGWAARRGSRGRTRVVTLWYGIELRWVKSRLPWLKQFLKWALKTSDQVVAISSYTAREIADLVHVTVRVIPYGLGVVLIEAMAYRIPVIGSAIGGITDIISDGKTGLLVPPEDPAAIAAAIERIATDPTLAERLALAGSQRVRERFGWDAIIAAW